MSKKITALLLAALVLCSISNIRAQQAMGLIAGNHNAPYSALQNPANTYSDRNRVYINFWGAQIGFNNNFLTYNAPFGLYKMATGDHPQDYQNPDGSLNFQQGWLPWDATQTQKLYYLNEVYGPSISFRTSRRTAVGFGMRGISGLSIDGLGPQLGALLRYGMDTSSLAYTSGALKTNEQYKNGEFSINSDRYQEWYFSLAGVTRDRGAHFVKWGATGKLLFGMGASGISGSGLEFKTNSQNQLEISNTNLSYYHTDQATASQALSNPLGLKFGNVEGIGTGMDLGFVYEYRPDGMRKTVRDWWTCADEKRNDYSLKFGASVTDLGFIAYEGSRRDMKTEAVKTWNITAEAASYKFYGDLNNFDSPDTGFFDNPAVAADKNDRFATTTPAAFNAQLDLNLKNNIYVGFNWQQNLKSVNSMGIKKSSYVSMVPRWESEHVEIGVPITLTRDYTDLNVGLYGRLGPVIIGTDNLAGLAKYVGNDNYQSANIYFALRMQIAACGRSRYSEPIEDRQDSIRTDSVFQSDTMNFWERDTIIQEKIIRDTIRIEKRDTIIKYRNSESPVDISGRELALSKKEAELKKREEDLKLREAAVVKKETNPMSTNSDCARRITELEEQLKRERELYTKLNAQYNDCKDEKERAKVRIAELERELAKLRAEYKVLSEDNITLRADNDRLKAEIIRLKAGSSPVNTQVKTLDSLLAVEQSKNIQLKNENSKQKAEVVAVKKENEEQKKRIAELEAEIARLKATCTDKAACDKAIKDLQDQLAAEKAKSAGLQTELTKTKAAYQVALDRTKALEEQLKNASSGDIAKVQAELDAQKKINADLNNKIKALESDKLILQTENSTQKTKIFGLEKDLAESKAKLDAANKTIAELQEKLKNCGDPTETAALKAEIESLKKANSDKDAQISALKSDKSRLESELSTAKSKIADLETQLKNCKSTDCSELEAQLADYKYKAENAEQKYSAIKAEYDALLADWKVIKAKLADCEEKLKNCTAGSEELSKLETEITKLKQTIGALQSELNNKQKSLDDLQDAYDKVSGEKSTLEKQVSTLQGQISTLNKKVADLEAQLKACQEGGSTPGGGGN